MGFFSCSCVSKAKNDVIEDESGKDLRRDAPTSLLSKTTANDNNVSTASLYYFDAMTEQEEEDLASSMYFDTRESLTDSMMYRPATPNSSFKFKSFSLETKASSKKLLLEEPPIDQESDRELGQRLEKTHPNYPFQSGYPGCLTEQELEAVLTFRNEIKRRREKEPYLHGMAYCWKPVEDEAFALCRFMRSRKFVVDDVFALMEGNLDNWKEGQAYDFYPDLKAHLGCPLSVLWTQLPYFQYGTSKNGSIVYYFQPGTVSLEALDCLTDLENFVGFIWHQFMHSFKDKVAKAQNKHPDIIIRSEQAVVVDLKGITRSLFTSEVMDILKRCTMAFNCFPEILNKLIIMNAPFFFSAIWLILKQFLDARTVSKIDIYSNQSKALQCISEHIGEDELILDYGGSALSSADILQEFAREEENGCIRQIVQRFFLERDGTTQYEFDLASSEKVTIIVFTRSEKGAQFTFSRSKEVIKEMHVKRDNNRDISETKANQPYATTIASDTKGPGHFVLSALSQNSVGKGYFLVQIRINSL